MKVGYFFNTLIKAIWIYTTSVLEAIPTSLYLLFTKSEESLSLFKEAYVDFLLEAYQNYEKSEFFYQDQEKGLERKVIIKYLFGIQTVPLMLNPKIRKEIVDQSLKLAYHKIDWKLKMDGPDYKIPS